MNAYNPGVKKKQNFMFGYPGLPTQDLLLFSLSFDKFIPAQQFTDCIQVGYNNYKNVYNDPNLQEFKSSQKSPPVWGNPVLVKGNYYISQLSSNETNAPVMGKFSKICPKTNFQKTLWDCFSFVYNVCLIFIYMFIHFTIYQGFINTTQINKISDK